MKNIHVSNYNFGLPQGWSQVPVRYSITRASIMTSSAPTTIALENIESFTGRLVESDASYEGLQTRYQSGDILFGKLRPYLAKVHLAQTDGGAIGDIWVLKPNPEWYPKYLYYQISNIGFIDAVNSTTTGAKMPRADWDHFSALLLVRPPLNDQIKIVSFLDGETKRIDALIERKRRYISILFEKQSAIVAHATSKGITHDVQMKSSGFKWLGDIPAHWKVVPPSALFRESKERARVGDQMLSATQKYGVIPLAEFESLERRQVTKATMNLEMRKHVEIGDFVISMRSMDGGLERARAIGSVRSSYAVLKPGTEVEGRFYGALLKSVMYIQALRLTSNFIRDGQDLNFNHVRQVHLPKPPLMEQILIADYIESKTMRINALIAKIESSIELLKEHRSALIVAAVAGKIDVLGDTAKNMQAAA